MTFSSDGVHHAPVSMVLDSFTPKATSVGCAGLGDGVDSDWIKTVRIKSELLSAFWGRDIEIEVSGPVATIQSTPKGLCLLRPPTLPHPTSPHLSSHSHSTPTRPPLSRFRRAC